MLQSLDLTVIGDSKKSSSAPWYKNFSSGSPVPSWRLVAAVGNHSLGSTTFFQQRGFYKAGLGWGAALFHPAAPVPVHARCWWCRALVGDHLLLKATKLQGLFEGRWITGVFLPVSTCAVCQARLVWVISLVALWVLQLQSM